MQKVGSKIELHPIDRLISGSVAIHLETHHTVVNLQQGLAHMSDSINLPGIPMSYQVAYA